MRFSTGGRVLALTASMLVLAACGARAPTFDGTLNDVEALFDEFDGYSETVVMPTGGSATYNGYGVFTIVPDEDPSLISDMALTANFLSDTVTGKFDSFIDTDNRRYDGQLNVSAGTISGNAVSFSVGGTISAAGESYSILGFGNGTFGGPGGVGAPGVAGTIDATMNGTGGAQTVDGFFFGKR